MPFTSASIATVVRCGQKDAEILNTVISPKIHELLQLTKLVANRFDSTVPSILQTANLGRLFTSHMESISNLAYLALTTVYGNQTIGEEYVNIVQVDSSMRRQPHLLLRVCMVILNCFGLTLFINALQKLQYEVERAGWIAPYRKKALCRILASYTSVLSWIHRFHRSLFFISLTKDTIARQLTSISYVSIRPSRQPFLKGFTLLGYLGLIESVATLLRGVGSTLLSFKASRINETGESTLKRVIRHTGKCPLCYEVFKDITVTSCGHLFCWNCIYPWCYKTPFCPLCRSNNSARDLVILHNYEI